jgi:hypothetical protein
MLTLLVVRTKLPKGNEPGMVVGTLVGVLLGGTGVEVGGTFVAVGGTFVAVGGTLVAVGGTLVAVGADCPGAPVAVPSDWPMSAAQLDTKPPSFHTMREFQTIPGMPRMSTEGEV